MATKKAPTTPDFGSTEALFNPRTLADASSINKALGVLGKLLESDVDERWGNRLVDVFRTPFPANYKHESARSKLFLIAGSLLVNAKPAGCSARLVTVLNEVRAQDTSQLYLIELIGKLGTPADAIPLCDWFEQQSARAIQGSAWSVHAIMVDALVRLGSAETFARIQTALELELSDHHRWSYERALGVLMENGPPTVGTSVLPEP